MYIKFDYKEISLLNKIFSNVDIITLTDEEKVIFLKLKSCISSEKEEIDKDREYLKELEEDFKKQKETNNFKYLCGACSGTCFPRCLGLYNKKYCNGMFDCKSRVKNPAYRE